MAQDNELPPAISVQAADGEYGFIDIVTVAEELDKRITAVVQETPTPATKEISDGSTILLDLLRDRREQDAMMAEDLIGISLALTGKSRAESIDDFDNDCMETQASTGAWADAMFPHLKGPKNRALGCFEEGAELAFAAGCTAQEIADALRVVIEKQAGRKEAGNPEEEAGDLQILLWTFAEDSQFDVYEAAEEKMAFNRSRPKEYYAAKTREKVLLGMPYVETTPKPEGTPEDTPKPPPAPATPTA